MNTVGVVTGVDVGDADGVAVAVDPGVSDDDDELPQAPDRTTALANNKPKMNNLLFFFSLAPLYILLRL
jgi:hypothetical protein